MYLIVELECKLLGHSLMELDDSTPNKCSTLSKSCLIAQSRHLIAKSAFLIAKSAFLIARSWGLIARYVLDFRVGMQASRTHVDAA